MPFVGEPRALLVAKGIGRKPLDRLERRGEEATAVVDAQRPSGRQRTQAERARDHRTRSATTVRLKDCPSVTRRSLRRTTRHKWASSAALRPAERRSTVRSPRSEEHTSELQSLMRTSYAVFCLKNKKTHTNI